MGDSELSKRERELLLLGFIVSRSCCDNVDKSTFLILTILIINKRCNCVMKKKTTDFETFLPRTRVCITKRKRYVNEKGSKRNDQEASHTEPARGEAETNVSTCKFSTWLKCCSNRLSSAGPHTNLHSFTVVSNIMRDPCALPDFGGHDFTL